LPIRQGPWLRLVRALSALPCVIRGAAIRPNRALSALGRLRLVRALSALPCVIRGAAWRWGGRVHGFWLGV